MSFPTKLSLPGVSPRFRSSVLPQPRMTQRAVGRSRDGTRADADGSGLGTNFSTPPPDSVNDGMGNYFEGLRVSKDRTGIPYASVHMRPQILRLLNGLNRKLLAAVGRYLCDNNGMAAYAVSTIANYSCPVRPHSACGDESKAVIYDEFFAEWSKRCDYTKRFTFDELQRLCCSAIDQDGDIGCTITAESGYPQLRLFDTFHIGTLTGLDPKDGVASNERGVLMGYNVVDGPIETLQSIANRFFSCDQMLLLRDVARWDNYRGFSPIRRGSNDLRDGADIKAFLKLQEKIRSAFGGVIQQNGPLEEDVWSNNTGETGDGKRIEDNPNSTPQEKKLSLFEMLGGDFPVIEGELKLLDTKLPGVTGIEFLDFLAGQFVAGLEIPPAFYLDEKLTGPNIRAVLNKAQKKFDQRKAVMARLVEFCWMRVIAWGISKGELPPCENWWKITFQFPPLLSIDLGDVMSNERQDVLCGQMSEKERFGNRGKDRRVEHAQIVSELQEKLAAAVQMKKNLGDAGKEIPITIILSRMGFNVSNSASVSDPNAQTNKPKPETEDPKGKTE